MDEGERAWEGAVVAPQVALVRKKSNCYKAATAAGRPPLVGANLKVSDQGHVRGNLWHTPVSRQPTGTHGSRYVARRLEAERWPRGKGGRGVGNVGKHASAGRARLTAPTAVQQRLKLLVQGCHRRGETRSKLEPMPATDRDEEAR